MVNELINKTVEVLVAFATYVGSGSTPDIYKGTLIAIDNEFCKIKLLKSKNEKDIVLIATKFIVSIKEI